MVTTQRQAEQFGVAPDPRKEELAKQAREAQEKATELLKELAAKVKDAQTAVEALIAAAEPLKPEAELKLEVVNKMAASVQGKVEKAEEAIKECQDFVKEHSAAMRLSAVKRRPQPCLEAQSDEPEPPGVNFRKRMNRNALTVFVNGPTLSPQTEEM
ncbi:STOML2 [Symbiodinium sp. CCMP2592]|nr:STOML2 [Symbiodinium sp. CCMP2592]